VSVRIALSCAERTDEDLQRLADELSAELNEVRGLDAEKVEAPAAAGSRGDASMLANLALTFLSSGAAVAAINVLKAYFAREPSLVATIKDADGDEIRLEAKGLSGENQDRVVRMLEKAAKKKR
jgi:hypothetical protein